ncbi:hypothetical protein [Pseudomonas siliginis]|uniref:hypothetical protein n=1 Tax=Pseudomonas siliginis TaxID=2842346 RepID=UPI00209329D4|nr:hypothetical protein [Pseudomonas siliginis]USU02964.1 hypothetical protein NF680_12080 [Pseudomonas siliginis]
MFNMATMAADECRTDATEMTYSRWISRLGAILGHFIAEGSDEESDAFDYYADGCTPVEAAAELKTGGTFS